MLCIEKFVREKNGQITNINWEALAKLKRKVNLNGQGVDFNSIFNNILEYLKEKGRMSYSAENTFTLTGGGIDLSPKLLWTQDNLRFAREEDAKKYKEAFLKYNYCEVFVRPTANTI